MPSLHEVIDELARLKPAQVEWLHSLVGDWQLLADLSFADLVLWLRRGDGSWVAGAHVRPTTGMGVFLEDLVGEPLDAGRTDAVEEAFRTGTIMRSRSTTWRDDVPVREEMIPVRCHGEVIAVLSRHTNMATMRTPSRLEVTYLATADALSRMIATGAFPHPQDAPTSRRGTPRVGDGVMRLDADGVVRYASPNAVSAMNRLRYSGPVIGVRLPAALGDILPDRGPVDEELMVTLSGKVFWQTEIQSRSAYVSVRSIPLTENGRRIGAVLLVRDVSELRRRERELLTKDATIREIHHRVKNNLQTVAAVLRLEARRLDDPNARSALENAVRRVGTIATVHETLSFGLEETVPFDEVATRTVRQAIDLANRTRTRVKGEVVGSFGTLTPEDATSLAMVLAELVQNAVEHGFADEGGQVTVHVQRAPGPDEEVLTMTVEDDGAGLPPTFEPGRGGLGTQIVVSLVQDLRGSIRWEAVQPHGTRVRLTARLRAIRR